MNSPDRYLVKKIYVFRSMLWGLVFGLVIGIIFGLVQLLFSLSLITIIMETIAESLPSGAGMADMSNYIPVFSFKLYSIVVGVYAVCGLLIGFFGALLYNILSLIGVRINIDLAKYLIAPKIQPVNIGSASPVNVIAKPVVPVAGR